MSLEEMMVECHKLSHYSAEMISEVWLEHDKKAVVDRVKVNRYADKVRALNAMATELQQRVNGHKEARIG